MYQEEPIDTNKQEEYIKKTENKEIGEGQREILNTPISYEEMIEAREATKVGKSPGPDGFTANFFRIFKEDLAGRMQMIFNRVLEGGGSPKKWQLATITMIPKDENVCPNVRNFKPISLLNTDYKNFTKILAERMKKVLKETTGEDQTGFLPGRLIRDNVRMVIDITEYGDKTPGKKLGFFLDAEKAFDNLNGHFMKKVLKKMRFSEIFFECN